MQAEQRQVINLTPEEKVHFFSLIRHNKVPEIEDLLSKVFVFGCALLLLFRIGNTGCRHAHLRTNTLLAHNRFLQVEQEKILACTHLILPISAGVSDCRTRPAWQHPPHGRGRFFSHLIQIQAIYFSCNPELVKFVLNSEIQCTTDVSHETDFWESMSAASQACQQHLVKLITRN